jgi:hypothetical protein
MPEEPTTQELKAAQIQRETLERRQAEVAIDEDETAQHARRAEKAQYLREKLEEREQSEQEVREQSEQEVRAEPEQDG